MRRVKACGSWSNLALHDDPRYSLKDEAGCVRDLDMEYIHIPVQFKAPTEENLLAFFAAMDAASGFCDRPRTRLVDYCADGASWQAAATGERVGTLVQRSRSHQY
jgi:protein tyrosine phosphatase (PTP) superfamily phosphohydrolase (DUF442 family)